MSKRAGGGRAATGSENDWLHPVNDNTFPG